MTLRTTVSALSIGWKGKPSKKPAVCPRQPDFSTASQLFIFTAVRISNITEEEIFFSSIITLRELLLFCRNAFHLRMCRHTVKRQLIRTGIVSDKEASSDRAGDWFISMASYLFITWLKRDEKYLSALSYGQPGKRGKIFHIFADTRFSPFRKFPYIERGRWWSIWSLSQIADKFHDAATKTILWVNMLHQRDDSSGVLSREQRCSTTADQPGLADALLSNAVEALNFQYLRLIYIGL